MRLGIHHSVKIALHADGGFSELVLAEPHL